MAAVEDSAWTNAPPPFELVEAWLCEHYHCVPSVLAEEPADRLLQYWQISNLYSTKRSKLPPALR